MASKELQQTVLQRARASQARKGSMGIDMDSSEGLLNLADQAGLGENARRALEPHSGVSGKFLSGGWISDTMDILNASIYGVAGMAKGKTFIQGVEDRDSFSDVDMLGKYGTSGKIAGFIADIALDPLNYVPVFGWAKGAAKATGFARVFGNMSSKVVGELKTISIGEGTAEAADVTIRVGGMSVVRALGDSFVYGFGSSRKAYDSIQLAYGRAESVAANSTNLLENFSKMPANAKKNILKFAEDGSVQTINRDEALRLFSGDELKHTLGVLDAKQDLVTRLVKEGGVSKEVAERDFDSYLTQQYDDVIEARISKPGQGSYPTSGCPVRPEWTG